MHLGMWEKQVAPAPVPSPGAPGDPTYRRERLGPAITPQPGKQGRPTPGHLVIKRMPICLCLCRARPRRPTSGRCHCCRHLCRQPRGATSSRQTNGGGMAWCEAVPSRWWLNLQPRCRISPARAGGHPSCRRGGGPVCQVLAGMGPDGVPRLPPVPDEPSPSARPLRAPRQKFPSTPARQRCRHPACVPKGTFRSPDFLVLQTFPQVSPPALLPE